MTTILSVIVPIFNESESLRLCLPKIVEYCQSKQWQLILVDDGSTDSSMDLLKAYEHQKLISIFSHFTNRGYGAAIKTGIIEVSSPYVATVDADGQHTLKDVDMLLTLAIEQNSDLIIGSRLNRQNENNYRKVGKSLIKSFARLLMPLPIEDLNSGLKLYRTSLVQRYSAIAPNSMAFSEVITLCFISQGHKVEEYPITINSRIAGKSTINLKTAFDTVLQILNISILFNPLRIFGAIALFFVFAGILWGLPFVLLGRGVSVGALLAIMAGLIFFSIGLIAHQISALRMQLLHNPKHNN